MEVLNHGKHRNHGKLHFSDDTYQIQGAVFAVCRELGTGFLEAVYQECLMLEMSSRNIPFVARPSLSLNYRGQALKQTYVPDFVVFERIILELNAVREFAPEHRAQLLNYLKATGLHVGLLVNFGCAPMARVERVVL
jgi:GxxExxY protein